jgi:hypothetical protein
MIPKRSRDAWRTPCARAGRAVVVADKASVRDYSRKPDEAYELIESYFPNLPKIELFARRARPGWDRWGAEVPEAEGPRRGRVRLPRLRRACPMRRRASRRGMSLGRPGAPRPGR